MLEARGLCVHYPCAPKALDGVAVHASPGEIVAVVGPNGSGKSTLLRTIAGLVRPHTGTVLMNGESLAPLPPYRRAARGLIYVPEGGRTIAGLSVRENMLVGAWLHRKRPNPERDPDRALELLPPLREHLGAPAETLSTGDRRMLSLARALMSEPRVLLIDEPLAGLDARRRGFVVNAIRTSRDSGVAVLMTEHDLPGVTALADRAYVLRAGQVVFSGSAAASEHAAAFIEIYD